MKKIILIFVILLLIINTLGYNVNSLFLIENKKGTLNVNISPIKDIEPKDDAFHGFNQKYSLEWWYFDAILNNNYSIHLGIKIISFGEFGVVREFINFYNDSKIENKVYSTSPIDIFDFSKEYPIIKKNNNNLMEFDYKEYNKTDRWNYKINLNFENLSINLTFIGITKGFKYETSNECWTIAQPKAIVNGIIFNRGKIIPVSGTGYHDHNWNFSISTGIRAKGWFWGKIISENYTCTWVDIIKNKFTDSEFIQTFGIVNIINNGYEYIYPENIKFNTDKREFYQGRFIPTEFSLRFLQNNIDVNVTFSAISIERYPPIFLTIHYWRYFVLIDGYIKINNNIDYLNKDLQIIEFMRFI